MNFTPQCSNLIVFSKLKRRKNLKHRDIKIWRQRAAFFFSRENQKCAWNVFLAFFRVFSRTKIRFHAHYFATFHGQSEFSRAIFRIFSRMDFYFHGKKIDIFENFHVRVSFFHAIKKGPEFQPIEMKFQTRTIFWILRIEITISVWYLKSKI